MQINATTGIDFENRIFETSFDAGRTAVAPIVLPDGKRREVEP
jgi:hypothetical protein